MATTTRTETTGIEPIKKLKRKEVFQGWRSFIFFVTTTAFFVWFMLQGKGQEAYWTWALTCTAWLGKNYLSSKD